jgi:NAD(P)-dependent dehydrogenase (short-subunit alcohol dehydrogenase family)
MGALMRLDGKVALVTGASRGIGRAIAVRLASVGATVAVHYGGSREEAETTLAQVEEAGGQGFLLQADLAAPGAAAALTAQFAAALTERTGATGFDILVNNAGIGRRAPIEEIDEAEFDRIVTVNLKAPFFLIQGLLPNLREGGRIINISSMGTRAAFAFMPVYAPSKAGLEALTRVLAVHCGPRGITVNAVTPGATATDMNAGARDPVQAQVVARTIALGRVGQPEDIAEIVGFLASDEGRWITGQTIDASGGQRL